MEQHADLAKSATQELIRADAQFFRDFALSPELATIQPIVVFPLLPFLTMFVTESSTYLSEEGLISAEDLRPHSALLGASRQRAKLLDDKYRSVGAVLRDERVLTATTSRWFDEEHRGVLGPIKRLLQCDLGIYCIDGELLSTTDVAFLNIGLTEQAIANSALSLCNLGPFAHDMAIDLGKYTRKVLVTLGLDVESASQVSHRAIPTTTYRDVNSHRYYNAIAKRFAPGHEEVSLLLTSMLSFANVARHVVPVVAGDNRISVFKMRFLSLHQLIVALEKLLEEHRRSPILDQQLAARIQELVSEESLLETRANRRLRNNLVHYRVNDTSLRLCPGPPLSGLVEACCAGKTLADVDAIARSGLNKVAEVLGNLMPPLATGRHNLVVS